MKLTVGGLILATARGATWDGRGRIAVVSGAMLRDVANGHIPYCHKISDTLFKIGSLYLRVIGMKAPIEGQGYVDVYYVMRESPLARLVNEYRHFIFKFFDRAWRIEAYFRSHGHPEVFSGGSFEDMPITLRFFRPLFLDYQEG